MIDINNKISIPEEELIFKASRSSGPGGQNVNKVSTRVTLLFDMLKSKSLSDNDKERIYKVLSTRISKKGVLRITSQRHRSQAANRQAVVDHFIEMLREALKHHPPRKKTELSEKAKVKRLENKRQRGLIKRERSEKHSSEY